MSQVTQERDGWSKVPHWLLTAVKPAAVVVYAQLAAYAWMPDGARPALKRVATDLGVSESTVERAVAELAKAGAVVVEARYADEDKRIRLPSRYHLKLTRGVNPAPPGVTGDATPGVIPAATLASPVTEEVEEEIEDEVSKTSTAPRKRGTRLPNPFPLREDLISWARQKAPHAGAEDHERFCRHWWSSTGRNATKLDWDMAWKNWMSTESERRSAKHKPTPSSRAQDYLEIGRQLQAEFDNRQQTLAIGGPQ